MNKEKVFAWIESLEDMADQSDRYFVERTELYRENQEKDKEIERLNNIINELERILFSNKMYGEKVYESSGLTEEEFKQQHPYTLGSYDNSVNLLNRIQELKEGK